MKILVTGGAGFIGSNFVRLVLNGSLAGVSAITVLDKLTYAGSRTNLNSLPTENFRFVLGDICDQELTVTLAKKHDVIINFAAESHVDRSIKESRNFVITNVLGTETLLKAAQIGGIKTFIQVSTDEVYGSINIGSSSESDPLLPNSPYAASKASSDLISRSYHKTYGLDVRITRSCNNYGRNQFPEKIIPLFITNLIDDLKIPIYGDGSNSREWIHVEDHCKGIYSVLLKGSPGEIYNIGGNIELTNLNLTRQILLAMGKEESSIKLVADRLGHDLRYSLDKTKTSHSIGFYPSVEWQIGLTNTINWYKSNEAWWRALKM